MQTLKRISDGAACKVHHTRNRTSLPLRNRKTEKDCGAQRCRNRFLNTVFSNWKSHATLTLLANQDLPTFGYNMIDPLKPWCWGSILFYPFKISRFS